MISRKLKKGINGYDVLFVFVNILFILYCFKTGGILQGLDGDLGDATYAVFAHVGESLRNGELPLWNPHLWGGYSAASLMVIYNPIVWIISYLCFDPIKNIVTFDVIVYFQMVVFFIFVISLYLLLRVLNFRRLVCMITSLGFAYLTSNLSFFSWIMFFSCIVFLPALIACFVLIVKSEGLLSVKYAAFAGIVIGMMGLSRAAQPFLESMLVYMVIYIFWAWQNISDKAKVISVTKNIMLSLAIGVLISAVALVPFIQFMGMAYRFVPGADESGALTYALFTEHSVTIESLNGIFNSTSRWFNFGVFNLIMIVAGFFVKDIKEKYLYDGTRFVFICSVLYSMGIFLPQTFYYIPFFNGIREPFLYVPLVIITSAIISAYGLGGILEFESPSKTFKNIGILMICITVIVAPFLLPHNYKVQNLIGFIGVCVLIVCWIIYSKLKNWKIQNVIRMTSYFLVILLLGLNLTGFYKYFKKGTTWEEKNYRIERGIESVHRIFENKMASEEDMFRVANWGKKAYNSNIASVVGFYDTISYINPIYYKTWDIHRNINIARRAVLQNIKYIVHGENENDDFSNWLKKIGFEEIEFVDNVYPNYSKDVAIGASVYKTEHYLGPAWLIGNVEFYDNDTNKEVIFATLNDKKFNLSERALVNRNTVSSEISNNIEDFVNGEIKLTKYTNNIVEYSVKANTSSMLITTDIYFPGWEVYIDGIKKDILEVNYAFRGVAVNEGDHTVTFKYLPKSLIIGCLMTFIGIFVAFGLIISCSRINKKFILKEE